MLHVAFCCSQCLLLVCRRSAHAPRHNLPPCFTVSQCLPMSPNVSQCLPMSTTRLSYTSFAPQPPSVPSTGRLDWHDPAVPLPPGCAGRWGAALERTVEGRRSPRAALADTISVDHTDSPDRLGKRGLANHAATPFLRALSGCHPFLAGSLHDLSVRGDGPPPTDCQPPLAAARRHLPPLAATRRHSPPLAAARRH